MNLNDMAELVCKKVRKTDNESVSICKDFLRQRHEMIWHEELWRDSLVIVPVFIDPTAGTVEKQLDPTGYVLMPDLVQEVVAVRTDSREIPVEQLESFFRQDIDAFDASGEPVTFAVVPPVCYQFATATSMRFFSYGGASDDGTEIHVRYVGTNYDHNETTLTLGATVIVPNVLWVESATKPATSGEVASEEYPAVDEYVRVAIDADKTSAPQYQRIRLLEKPTTAVNLKVLAKRKLVGMTRDEDICSLRKMDNLLMAFAESDMQKRSRQHGKSREAVGEAMALLKQLRKTEVMQRAHNQRLIPDESAYSYDYDFSSSKGYW